MASNNQKKIVGEFISMDEACELLENGDAAKAQRDRTLSLHHVHCRRRGDVILIQGGNGEFAVVSLTE